MSIKKNFTYNFLYNLLILIIPLLLMPYISRVIGAEGVGVYSYTHAIANYFVLFAMMGLYNYGNRSIAKVKGDKLLLSKTFWSIYFFQFIFSLLALIAYFIFISFINPQNYKLALIQSIFVLSAIFDINWLFFGLEKFKLTVIRNTIVKVLTIIMIFILVKAKSDLSRYAIIMAVGFPLSHLLIWSYLKKTVFWYRPSLKEILMHLKPNIILFIPVISVSIYKIMDKVMIGSLSSLIQLGYYENAEKINCVQISLSTSLGTVMMPRMSNLIAKGNKEKYNTLMRDSMQFVLFLSIALSFGLIAISDRFVPLFLGNEFLPSSKVLIWLSPTGIFIAWANIIRTQYLIPNHKDEVYVISVIFGAAVNAGINLILIPKLGAIGAAIGTIFAEATVMLYQTISVRKYIDLTVYIKDSWFFIPIGIIMLACVQLSGLYVVSRSMGILVQIVIGALVYISLSSLYFLFFNKNRIQYLRKLL